MLSSLHTCPVQLGHNYIPPWNTKSPKFNFLSSICSQGQIWNMKRIIPESLSETKSTSWHSAVFIHMEQENSVEDFSLGGR